MRGCDYGVLGAGVLLDDSLFFVDDEAEDAASPEPVPLLDASLDEADALAPVSVLAASGLPSDFPSAVSERFAAVPFL
jgi:hypothetical protein